MNSMKNKRQVDFQVIAEWIHHGEKILDLGCGRGVLLEFLKQRNNIYGIGVDLDFDKILSCLKRGVNAYQGDIKSFLNKPAFCQNTCSPGKHLYSIYRYPVKNPMVFSL